MDRRLKALRELIKTIEEDNKKESDDFDYWLMENLRIYAGQTLYQYTRGSEGIKNNLELRLSENARVV